jgi:hypothetical protein
MRSALSFVVLSCSLLCACGSSTPGSSSAGGNAGASASGGAANGGTASVSAGAPSAAGAPSGTGGALAGAPAVGGGGSSASGAGAASVGGSSSGGASTGSCTRDALNAAADSYVAAIVAGDASKMALAAGATYAENMKTVAIAEGILKTALPVAFHRNLLDTEQCETFSEIIITEGGHPYVLGAHLKLTGASISAIDTLVTDDGDWLFDAAAYLKYSKAEDWSLLPTEQQISRAELIAAANAYFDLFSDKTVEVPWGTPCSRLEGGKAYTGMTCDVGVPSGITFANKHFVVDIPMGTSVGIVRFGGANGLPDSHMFRVPSGKIRYVHTITVCNEPNCGM